jgi:hypothetical protein
MKLCNHEGCGGKYYARGMCVKHYSKWMRAVEVKPKKPNAQQLVLDALPGTSKEIAAKTELCICAVRDKLRELRGNGVYVSSWKGDGLSKLAVYSRGNKKDVPRPCMTTAEYSRRYRQKHPEKVQQRSRTQWAIQKAKARPNSWLGALGIAA